MTVFFYSCTVLADDVNQKLAEIQQNIVLGNLREAQTQIQKIPIFNAYTETAIKGLYAYLILQSYSTNTPILDNDGNRKSIKEAKNLLSSALKGAQTNSLNDLSVQFSLYLGQMNEELARQNEKDKQKYLTEAKNNYLLVKNYAKQLTDKSLVVSSLCSLAKLDIENKEFNEGWKILQQAKTELENLTISKELASQLLLSIGYQDLQLYLQNPTQNKYLAEANDTLNKSLTLARENNQIITQVLSLNYLAQLYKQQNRQQEAKELLLAAAKILNPPKIPQTNDVSQADDVLFDIYKQLAEIYKNEHSIYEELVASREAVKYLERIRFDIPITDKDGKSSFDEDFAPLYLRFADLLLQQAAKKIGQQQQDLLVEARNIIELMKKSEMEDYVKERCRPSVPIDLKSKDPHAAVIYPVILDDRLEIIVGISDELHQFTQAVKSDDLKNIVELFSKHLHSGEPFTSDSKPKSEFLYKKLISPIKALLEKEKIKTLVYVPSGFLRLIPLASLYDGKRFLIQDYAVVTSVGMSLIENKPNLYENQNILLAGLSVPGDVINELPESLKSNILPSSPSEKQRGLSFKLRSQSSTLINQKNNVKLTEEELREKLTLPGVKNEINALSLLFFPQNTNSCEVNKSCLLDKSFSLARFEQEITTKPHKFLFIASHGFFGETEEENFILTDNKVLNMKKLRELLDEDYFKKHPIDLITLSACHTAESGEKIPLGLSGMAIKSKVHSALGSLWSVPDDSTKELMLNFYTILKENSENKARALQQAQINYLKSCDGEKPKKPKSCIYPSNWAAFILVGDWQ